MASDQGHFDTISGQTTTGHEWDGIRELNTPLPRWWLWLFYLTIAFSLVYWILYPAWPLVTGYSGGILGYTNRTRVAADLATGQTAHMEAAAGLEKASLAEIENDPKLLEVALARGKAAFGDNCAPCHGAGGQGQKGYPNLTAGRWLWGGMLEQIQTTITHGARFASDSDTHMSAMPAFGKDGILKPEQIRQVVSYVRTLDKLEPEAGVDVEAGKKIFADNCAACHGDDGKGNVEMGAPNLTTKVWLYGNDTKDLIYTVTNARNSTMPAWGGRLDPVTIKSLALYVYSLGGGQ
ncbi:MAG TPA: cytochrome-c oxidase, cbb3-type subunit III [Roseiarcus sp.]|nr:cytochrome-c oxidase, cbb3-type subunit III [Roseiarcus sp.]